MMHDSALQISVFLPQAPDVSEQEGRSWPESNSTESPKSTKTIKSVGQLSGDDNWPGGQKWGNDSSVRPCSRGVAVCLTEGQVKDRSKRRPTDKTQASGNNPPSESRIVLG